MGSALRARFAAAHEDVFLLDVDALEPVERYLLGHRLMSPDERPCRIERAGAGNMNLVLRVSFGDRSLILKQGRPWVEKYDQIAAPWERTLVEGGFYSEARCMPVVASGMPRVLHLDKRHHILALEDLGPAADWSSMYGGTTLPVATLTDLLEWLKALGTMKVAPRARELFTNRAMRALNHEHIFSLPLRDHNGLDLDGITPGLAALANDLQQDRTYCARVAELGARYLSDGSSLVHGDFFPGSWVHTPGGVRVIDPEFCFLGSREFDYGVMVAHLALTGHPYDAVERVLVAVAEEYLDERLVLGFAGTEIMRRLIGVAQLPAMYDLDPKRGLLEISRELVKWSDPRWRGW